MTTQHTSGPWIRVARANGKLGETICFMGTDELTATDICRVEPEDDNGAAIKVADANARLISASPDLLGALLKVKTDMLRDDFDSENDRCDYVLAYVSAALAKVVG